MVERLRKAIVDSFVGAIAMGWIFSQSVAHFSYILTAPLANWIARNEYPGFLNGHNISAGFFLQDSLLEAARSFALLLFGYLLLRWLYFKPSKEIELDPARVP